MAPSIAPSNVPSRLRLSQAFKILAGGGEWRVPWMSSMGNHGGEFSPNGCVSMDRGFFAEWKVLFYDS